MAPGREVTEPREQRARGTVVEALSSALERGGSGLANAPELLRRLLTDESWRSFVTQRGELVEYNRLEEFVTTPPLKGLGVTAALVRRVIGDDPVLLDLFDRALSRGHGGDRHSTGFKLHNIQLEETTAPTGTSQAAGLRRLRKDRPDLHADVLAGRLSTHAAMVQAGFRRKTAVIPIDRAESAARALRKNMPPEALAELARLISD